MTLLVRKGSFSFPAATGPIVETGVGFQPKAMLLWFTRQTAVGYAANVGLTMGFVASPTERGSLSMYSADAVGAVDGVHYIRNDDVLAGIGRESGISVVTDQVDLTSFDADGFTLAYTRTHASQGGQWFCHYIALGGSDLQDAWVGTLATPIVTGTNPYTGVGFKPDCLILLGALTHSAIPQTASTTKFGIGVADGVNQATAFVEENSTIPTDLHSIQKGEIMHALNQSGTDNTVATLASFDADGFTLNFSTVQSTARYFHALALKGGRYKVITDTQKTSTGTKAKTGVGFQPSGLLLFGTNRVSSTVVDATLASLSIGGSDGVREGASWVGSVDNVSTTEENSATVTDKVFRHVTGPSTTDAEADLASFDVDGYTLNWSTADAVAREFVGLAIGSSLGSQHLAPSADSVDGTWTDQGGGTSLAAAIGEAVFSDTDYIQSVDSPSAAGCRVKLAAGSDPALSTGHVIHWRVRKNVAGQTVDMTVKLYQGGGNVLGAGTLIATRTRNNVSTAFATFDETLTGTEADSITNYADLYLEFYATAS